MNASTMRAWISADPGIGSLVLSDVAVPRVGERDALVSVEAAALNFSDLLMIDDRYQIRPDRPFIPGQEIAGIVVAAGPQSGLVPGERIASKVLWGGFARNVLVRGDMAILIPEQMSSAQASALPVVYTTAMVALTESTTIRSGETVLVLAAAGGVGLAAVEIARHLGARVIAAAGGFEKCELARKHGAQETIDYRAPDWGAQLKSLTGERGVDVIVDPVGGSQSKDALRTIAWEGRLLIVGFSSGEIPQIPANLLLLRRACAIGVYWDHDRDAQMLARVSSSLATLAREGAIRPHVYTYSFADLPNALADLRERRTTGKAVLSFDTEDAQQ